MIVRITRAKVGHRQDPIQAKALQEYLAGLLFFHGLENSTCQDRRDRNAGAVRQVLGANRTAVKLGDDPRDKESQAQMPALGPGVGAAANQ